MSDGSRQGAGQHGQRSLQAAGAADNAGESEHQQSPIAEALQALQQAANNPVPQQYAMESKKEPSSLWDPAAYGSWVAMALRNTVLSMRYQKDSEVPSPKFQLSDNQADSTASLSGASMQRKQSIIASAQ